MTDKIGRLTGYLLIVIACLVPACGFHIELPNTGKVMDAETQEPLQNVVVTKGIEIYCTGIGAGGDHETIGLVETLTDEKGHYDLPAGTYFYAMKPFFCYHDQNFFIFFKSGYFESRVLTSDRKTEVSLYKMTRFLNYLAYKKSNMFLPSELEEKSKLLKIEIEKLKALSLEPLDESGIFLRLEGRKLTGIHSREMKDTSYRGPDSRIYYVYDNIAKGWINIDSRGKILDLKPSLPKWEFIDSSITWGWPIYASNNTIFYPIEENPVPVGLKYKKGEIQFITPQKGDISDLAGTADNFFTIEDRGSSLCHYGKYFSGENYYLRKLNGEQDIPYHVRTFTGGDLPVSQEDNTLKDTEFKHIVQTLNHGYFLVAKSHKYWHIYNVYGLYGRNTGEKREVFKELISFPVEREITAFTATGNELYIAFKNEGIRKYDIVLNNGPQVKEDTSFNLNSRVPGNPTYKTLLMGRAVNLPAIYATAGDDKIYRFSLDGIPDYILKQ
jgi:hypothetical protein